MTLQSDFCTTLVDEWRRGGVREAVIAPGSRSSLLALALLAEPRIAVHVRLDERSAAFFALGIALGSRRPVVLVTTSGTAAAETHAAVLEADLARVPLLVCTADRPPELHQVGAPQTLEQVGLFGGAVRFALDAGVPDEAMRPHWRSMASRALAEAVASTRGPGPVHVNVALREPFVPELGVAAEGRADNAPWHRVLRSRGPTPETVEAFLSAISATERGLLVVGAGALENDDPDPLLALAEVLGWPILAEPRAFVRSGEPTVVVHPDAILRSARAGAHLRPECIVSLGAPHASKVFTKWLEACGNAGVVRLLVDPHGAFADPERQADLVLGCEASPLLRAAASEHGANAARRRPDPRWLADWVRADAAAEQAIEHFLGARDELDEPFVVRELFATVPEATTLVVSSSMPIRDLEWFAAPRPGAPRVLSNRGANGIDGVTSTVLGVAATSEGPPVVGVLGDLAFFYDLSALVFGRAERVPDATLVVIDNAGGGIFSFLDYAPLLDRATFERAFGTPQAPDCAAVARALGARVEVVASKKKFASALEAAIAGSGLDVIVVRGRRETNVEVHAGLAGATAAAVERELDL